MNLLELALYSCRQEGDLNKQTENLREKPAYPLAEAARYLGIPASTLRTWFVGQQYPSHHKRASFRPLFRPADRNRPYLSFLNLLEAHVLDAIRREHQISLQKVRRALGYLQRQFPSEHPLVEQRFQTDGIDLFVEKYGDLISATEEGQSALKEMLKNHLQRIERDPQGLPIRLYPFTRKHDSDEPKLVVIDPEVSYGQPVLAGTGITTAIIAERFKAGESIEQLAEDYGRTPSEIQEAIRCEQRSEAA